MDALPRRWIKWIAVILGAAGMLTPALIELGWIPEQQALKAVIFLLGFIVLEGATRESNESALAPELLTTREDYFHAMGGFSGREATQDLPNGGRVAAADISRA
jgi:hypothetical protein